MLDFRDKRVYIIVATIVAVLLLIAIYPRLFATKDIELYFADSQAQYLVAEDREVKANDFHQNIVKELIKGPKKEDLGVTIPPQTKVIGIEVNEKVAQVNFSKELETTHWSGSAGEMMTVYSIVNTLSQLEEIDKVQILVEGDRLETLAGHLDISLPLVFNKRLVEEK